ncbi:MAG: hypothetical protein AAF648_00950, partial [Pseudomonadota bacterium]
MATEDLARSTPPSASTADAGNATGAAAGRRQLLVLGGGAVLAFSLLVIALSGLASLTGASGASKPGIDATAKAITLALREEPPQLNSIKATDQVSGMILGHVMEGLLRYGAD